MIKNYNKFLTENEDFVNQIEDLILSTDKDNIDLAEQLMIGQKIKIKDLFNGEIESFINLHPKVVEDVEILELSIWDLLFLKYLKIDKYLVSFRLDSFNKINSIPISFLRKLKKKSKVKFLTINIHKSKLCLRGDLDYSDVEIVLIESSVESGRISCEELKLFNCDWNCLNYFRNVEDLDCVSCFGLQDFTKMYLKNVNKVLFRNISNIHNFKGFPKILKNLSIEYCKIHSFEGLLGEDYVLSISDSTIYNLKTLPKNINSLYFSEVKDFNYLLTKKDFENVLGLKTPIEEMNL